MASKEAGAQKLHKEMYVVLYFLFVSDHILTIIPASLKLAMRYMFNIAQTLAFFSHDVQDTSRTLIYTGRPLRVYKSPYVADWSVPSPSPRCKGAFSRAV